MEYEDRYKIVCESQLKGRYISPLALDGILSKMPFKEYCEVVGKSEKGRPIYSITIGKGSNKVFGWSQMHGNESTTTKALFDFLNFLLSKNGASYLQNHAFCFIPMLNPDGSALYTRENANGIDLNRDAQACSQSESQVLRSLFNKFQPNLCLNLHDQRSIYGLPNGNPAVVSFLAPAADEDLSITASRRAAMNKIAGINRFLQQKVPGSIGRYDDSFNPDCVGDTFQSLDVPTILFEAGHSPGDYERENTRELIFYSLMRLFDSNEPTGEDISIASYFDIPENQKNFRDIILREARVGAKTLDIAIQYEETLESGAIKFIPKVDSFGDLSELFGHKEVFLHKEEILINSHENVFVDEEIVTIIGKYSKKPINI